MRPDRDDARARASPVGLYFDAPASERDRCSATSSAFVLK